MKLLGKALVARQKSHDGSDVVMICGNFQINSDDDLAVLEDRFNIGILDLTINKGFVKSTDEQMSPEDFLESMDKFDWKDVVKTGNKIG